MPSFYEFFAGGGMARLGLGSSWTCTFANDNDPKKAASYMRNFGDNHLKLADVVQVTLDDLQGRADLAWASFPCQDLSLAGAGGGLKAARSGTFWPFWKLIQGLTTEGRGPRVIVLENVSGALTSNRGRDFAEIGRAINRLGYRFGALVMDAVHFLPQSRPRLFIVAVADRVRIPVRVRRGDPNALWHPRGLVEAKFRLPKQVQDAWVWWDLPAPPPRAAVFSDLIEDDPEGAEWHTADETQRLLAMMSPVNLAKVKQAQAAARRMVGGLYRRTRGGVQRAEVRFDDVAGCLRTPRGGSSRQTILVIDGQSVRSRLLSAREAARLMGLPDNYVIPVKYNDAYHLAGDGIVVPVVAHLNEHLLIPLVGRRAAQNVAAA